MKKINQLLLFFFSFVTSFSLAQDNWRMENDLEYHFQRVDYWRASLNADSANAEDSTLRNRLLFYTNNNPATLKDNFKYLKYYEHMVVLTSDDNAFRIYELDDGTKEQHNFINVFQYQDGNKTESSLTMPGEDASVLKGREYKDLYTLKTKGRIYYLATYVVPRTKDDYSVGVQVFTKNAKGGFNDSTQVIVTNTYGTAVNNLEYPLVNPSGATNHSIYFNKNNKMLYVPIIWNDGVVSSAYTEYKFNKSNYFTEVKKN
jgi:hypothetical protein